MFANILFYFLFFFSLLLHIQSVMIQYFLLSFGFHYWIISNCWLRNNRQNKIASWNSKKKKKMYQINRYLIAVKIFSKRVFSWIYQKRRFFLLSPLFSLSEGICLCEVDTVTRYSRFVERMMSCYCLKTKYVCHDAHF